MGSAIALGLAPHGYTLTVTNRSIPPLDALKAASPLIATATDNEKAVTGAHIVIVAVRPAQTAAVLDRIGPHIAPGALVVTLSPAQTLADTAAALPAGINVARLMPNTAVAVGASMSFIAFADSVPDLLRRQFVTAIGHLGNVAVIPEPQFGAVTALCSCGIAYALRYLHAACQGAVQAGIPAADAARYAAATMKGAAALLLASPGKHPEALIDAVTTPGGTTIRGLNAMEAAGFTGAVIQGILASSHE